MRLWFFTILLLVPLTGFTDDWQFSKPIVVSPAVKGQFHHLGASSRRAIAVSRNTVAIVWEDNRSGQPQIYAAVKKVSDQAFQTSVKISHGAAAYEPGITALSDGRFVVGWEAGERLWLRVMTETDLGEVTLLTRKNSRQIALHSTPQDKLVAVWAEQTGKPYQIHYAKLELSDLSLKVLKAVRVDKTPVKADQLYPSVYSSQAGIVVGWEDRRFGNTRIFTAFAGQAGDFSAYRLLNDFRQSRIARFGHGTGAMRIALEGDDQALVVASWLDKREFEGGYDVYAAVSRDGGKTFADDELAQDVFGENTPQWHNTVAVSHTGKIAIAWDDSRDETPHIWLSERVAGKWLADMNITGADDGVSESHPVICFDKQGRLHVAFVEQLQEGNRIMYLQGRK